MTAALDRAVANAMGLKSVHNCEKWVGLTDEERLEIRKRKWWDWEDAFDIDGFMQAVETKLKEKNT